MNKKNWLAIGAVVALLILVLSIMLICRSCAPANTDPENSTTLADPDTEETGEENGESTPSGDETTTDASGQDETAPSFSASMEVGTADDEEYGDETTAPTTPTQSESKDTVSEQTTATGENPGSSTESTVAAAGELTYAEYLALSSQERLAYYQQFTDDEAFVNWFNAAKEAYDEKNSIEVGSGTIDMGEILNP